MHESQNAARARGLKPPKTGECPLTVADRQGQVAHTRGSGETVAASPSDEEQMAIIFLCSILGDSLLALKRRRNPVQLDLIDLYLR